MKSNEINLNCGWRVAKMAEAFRKLEQERESRRWATDPLELGYKVRSGARRVRAAVASVFGCVARFCDRCVEILEE